VSIRATAIDVRMLPGDVNGQLTLHDDLAGRDVRVRVRTNEAPLVFQYETSFGFDVDWLPRRFIRGEIGGHTLQDLIAGLVVRTSPAAGPNADQPQEGEPRMTIRPSNVNVHLEPRPIEGGMLLHDDETHTVVPIEVYPKKDEPGFTVGPPRGDTIRDDFDDYRREAERIMHTLLAITSRDAADRDRNVSHTATAHHLTGLDSDREWQAMRWRYIRGDAGELELQTAAIARADPELLAPYSDPTPDDDADNGKEWWQK
jgi:hypothetical protein